MWAISKHLLALTLLYCNFVSWRANCVEFNRNFTGVLFSPYVLDIQGEPLFTIYGLPEIKTMLKVVSARFSRVYTIDTSNSRNYTENETYYNTYSEIFTAEAAAMLNREAVLANSSPILDVYTGIYLSFDSGKMETEIKLAFESVHKSNKIHSGTTKGLLLSPVETLTNITAATYMLSKVQEIKPEAKSLNLRVGIRTFCDDYKDFLGVPEKILDPLSKIRKTFLLHLDFIICSRLAEEIYFNFGISKAMTLVTKDLVKTRDMIHSINPNIEFMLETGQASCGCTAKHYEYVLDFWTMMDQWGKQNNIFVWMKEAFDNPWKNKLLTGNQQNGWWQLKKGFPLTDVRSYEEKFKPWFNKTSATERVYHYNYRQRQQTSSSQFRRRVISTKVQPATLSKQETVSKEKGTSVWVYIGSIAGPTIAVMAVALMFVQWIRTNRIRGQILSSEEIKKFMNGLSNDRNVNAEIGNTESQALNKPYDKSIEIPKNRIQIFWSAVLGSGEFGVVYKANITCPNGRDAIVALKMTKAECPKSAVITILSEIKILSYLGYHENILSIIGAYTSEIANGVVYIATEICELGCLKDFLRKLPKTNGANERYSQQPQYSNKPMFHHVRFTEMIQWSFEIACGMEYLAEKNVIHADLAARNVLLTANKKAKISDFGLSRRLYEYTNYVKKHQEPLPWRWMAIEALKNLEFSSQSDVWSYGVTLWEIFSMGDLPYPGMSWTLEFVDNLENGLRMKCPRLASREIYTLMATCWEPEPKRRPTFTQIKQTIAGLTKMYEIKSNERYN